ncbi:MAG: hypothetical protein ACQGVC_03330 [Myxococcota bacterium]
MTDDLRRHRERFASYPTATTSFELLEEDAFLNERWTARADLYRQRAAASSLADDAPARARVLLQLGQLLEERIADADGAIEAYRDCVRLDAARRPAWQGLRRLYAARQSWAAVLQVAELEAQSLDDTSERARLFHEMGEIWQQQLGDAEQAEQFFVRARFERDAEEPEPDLVNEAQAALVQGAWISAARGDSTSAVASLREALDKDPSNIEAIDMLVTVLDGAERHAEMAELLERRAALATDLSTRAAVLARLGLVREDQLGDMPGARSAYERALDADPRNQGAQVALIRIYRLTESWNELRRILEVVGAEGSSDQRVGALCQLGLLLERQFDDVDAAISTFEEALALEPDCPDAKAALARLNESGPDGDGADDEEQAIGENRAVRVVGVLERKLERLEADGRGGDETAVKLRLRLAELRSSTLDDAAGAIEVLEPCVEDEQALGLVAQRLALLYERSGDHQQLMALARRAAAISADPAERAEWYRRAGETARSIGEGDVAVEFFGRLLEERPGDRHAEAALLTLYRTRGEAGPLAELLRRELSRAGQRDELPIHLELAGLLSGSLEDDRGALAHWRRALALDPTREDALEEALRCADATGGALHQLDLIEHLFATAKTREDRARLLLRRGDLLVRELGWADEGAESWRRSFELDPDQSDARGRLESLAASPA